MNDWNSKSLLVNPREVGHVQLIYHLAQDDAKVGLSTKVLQLRRSWTAGPVFLPSEHDELPPGVAFMVTYNALYIQSAC